MKKIILMLIFFTFLGQEIIAQWGFEGSQVQRTGVASRTVDSNNVNFDDSGDWSLDATISQFTSAQTLDGTQNQTGENWTGNAHDGHGASGWGSAALGAYNRSSGVGSFAAGFMNVAGPTNSRVNSVPPSTTNLGGQFAVGYGTAATGHVAFSSGYDTTASGNFSTAMGRSTIASGNHSSANGYYTTASGNRSSATGAYTTASDFGSMVIGQYNSSGSSITNSATAFNTANTAFVIGNGVDSSNKSDAFKVMYNGNTTISGDDLTIGNLSAFSGSFTQRSAIDVVAHSDGDLMTGYLRDSTGDRFNIELDSTNSLSKISSGGGYDMTLYSEGGTMNFESGVGTANFNFTGDLNVSNDLTISGDVVISSDARLKSNIVSLGSTLSRLLLIDGKSYYMKGKQKIGVLAQEIKEVFPELVTEDENENLAVNYQGLVPVLINALKEQESKVQEQEERIKRLEKLLLN
jgi:hypothetical protein